MTETCKHENLQQVSEATLRWGWTRQDDGTYKPDETYNKVLHEETVDFTCEDCGEIVFLDDEQKLEEVSA